MEYDLVIDLGNTNRKVALIASPSRQYPFGRILALESYQNLTIRELKPFINSHPGIRHAILASVVGHPEKLTSFLQEHFPLIILNSGTPTPLQNRYRSPDTLGYDRLAAAVAGATVFPASDVLVINAGTCLTFDFVNRRGQYLGGSISPGMQLRFRSLHTFTEKLPLISYRNIRQTFGTDTETALLTGVIKGILHEIEGVEADYRQQYPGLQVVFSGGDLKYFVKRLKISIFALPNCVTYGLYQILRLNAQNL